MSPCTSLHLQSRLLPAPCRHHRRRRRHPLPWCLRVRSRHTAPRHTETAQKLPLLNTLRLPALADAVPSALGALLAGISADYAVPPFPSACPLWLAPQSFRTGQGCRCCRFASWTSARASPSAHSTVQYLLRNLVAPWNRACSMRSVGSASRNCRPLE